MDYKKLKNEITKQGRERTLFISLLALAAVIAVQCISIGVLWSANRGYRAMYDEALEAQQLMQQEINILQNGSGNAEDEEVVTENGEG